jgi:ring-1,2-phenylacetyl-CoA epoxidase subunit PaaD
MGSQARPTVDDVWRRLSEIPDPEIPVISLVDLGVIRGVDWDGDTLVVAVAPTYSGCPATLIINLDIEGSLREFGVEKLRLERRLSPPWTTDWIKPQAREKLRAYGIAPPIEGKAEDPRLQGRIEALSGARLEVACPGCESTNTQKISQFGSTPCKANYRCVACLEPFEYFKCI